MIFLDKGFVEDRFTTLWIAPAFTIFWAFKKDAIKFTTFNFRFKKYSCKSNRMQSVVTLLRKLQINDDHIIKDVYYTLAYILR